MIPDRTWMQFSKAKENKDLNLTEQKQKYKVWTTKCIY